MLIFDKDLGSKFCVLFDQKKQSAYQGKEARMIVGFRSGCVPVTELKVARFLVHVDY